MPSGKRAKAQRRAAAPPPVRTKASGGGGVTLSRNTLLIIAAVVVLAAVGIGLGIGLSGGSSNTTDTTGPVDFSKIAGLQNGPPPWNNNVANLQQNLPIVNLNPLSMEGAVIHIHQHLDVYVNGKHVTVPANIGIFGTFLTELHTHDAAGIVHVESPRNTSFKLGQFFGEWGVWLSADRLGGNHGTVHWWVNGKPQTGDPANLTLSQHQEIVIVFGKQPAHIPSTFNFAAHGV